MKKPPGNVANLGRKGETRYPKVNLEKAEKYAKSLASKTHTSPQPLKIIAKGVFDTSTNEADVRLSACRQYGFVDGKNAELQASSDAKKLTAAVDADRTQILQRAFLRPDVFRKLHTGFQGDSKSKADIKSQFQQLEVHPDLADDCVECFISSGLHCGLIVPDGDRYMILKEDEKKIKRENFSLSQTTSENELDAAEDESAKNDDSEKEASQNPAGELRNKSNVAINIEIDSTMDPEKLSKLVKILKDNGLT